MGKSCVVGAALGIGYHPEPAVRGFNADPLTPRDVAERRTGHPGLIFVEPTRTNCN